MSGTGLEALQFREIPVAPVSDEHPCDICQACFGRILPSTVDPRQHEEDQRSRAVGPVARPLANSEMR